MKAIPTHGELRQQNCHEFKTNLGYIVNWGQPGLQNELEARLGYIVSSKLS